MTTFDSIYKAIHDYTWKLTGSKEKTDEITQEVFIKVHQSLHTLNDDKKILSWLKKIIYNTLIDHYRAENRFQIAELSDLMQPDDSADEEGFSDVVQCIEALIELMPPEERSLLMAIEVQGVSQTEYAQQHNLPISTVKSRIQRAREKLRTKITSNCFLLTDRYGNIMDYRKPENINTVL
ncbi:sigma-70 family RNA polymerase sigma factor [Chryseosolibacter indicus]|uniref:Sigma-70 family RNA polymerase sigma factor n=1 Tax=Chryseosolibacter indicus TaxID=2782351 RepID=A0ABS5VQN1_9BACT|nr:sigma-70 family RNA polymerase sigma factor [Chryseosolibacter indicus]MBT1703169.1 sigma-70 family RNA polymerase sigma factor [Chryseosolibacter indicus]